MQVTKAKQCGCSTREASDALATALTERLVGEGREVVARQIERSWAYGLVVLTLDGETMSVYVPMPGLCDELDDVAGRWVCERDGLLTPSTLAPCTPVDTVASWAAEALLVARV